LLVVIFSGEICFSATGSGRFKIEVQIVETVLTPDRSIELLRLLGIEEGSSRASDDSRRLMCWAIGDVQLRSLLKALATGAGATSAKELVSLPDRPETPIRISPGFNVDVAPDSPGHYLFLKPSRSDDNSTKLVGRLKSVEFAGYQSPVLPIFDYGSPSADRVTLLTALPFPPDHPEITIPAPRPSGSYIAPQPNHIPIYRTREFPFEATMAEGQTLVLAAWHINENSTGKPLFHFKDLPILGAPRLVPPKRPFVLIRVIPLPD